MPSHQPTRRTYPQVGPDDPITWDDLLSILDTHGLKVTPYGKGHRSPEAKIIRREFKAWVARQGVRPGLNYTMPLRALSEHISREHRSWIHRPGRGSWALVVDALNDPNSGLVIVRRRYARQRAA